MTPTIGRWLSRDPMGQYHSPYVGMGNDPINGVDPSGGEFDPPTGEGSIGEQRYGTGEDANTLFNYNSKTKKWDDATVTVTGRRSSMWSSMFSQIRNRFNDFYDWGQRLENRMEGRDNGYGASDADAYQLSLDVTLVNSTFSPIITIVPSSSGVGIGLGITDIADGGGIGNIGVGVGLVQTFIADPNLRTMGNMNISTSEGAMLSAGVLTGSYTTSLDINGQVSSRSVGTSFGVSALPVSGGVVRSSYHGVTLFGK
jgi:hypothetical protein